MKWVERKVQRKQNRKMSEVERTFQDLQGNLSEINDQPREKKLKAEKLQALTKYVLKYGRQGNLMTYFD